MFPSSTTHQVETKSGSNTRISLAFNTFYSGTLGSSKNNLTELILWKKIDIQYLQVGMPPHTHLLNYGIKYAAFETF